MSNITNATINSSSNGSSSNTNVLVGPLNVNPPVVLPKRKTSHFASPCVIRIPLTLAQEEYLQHLLYKKVPLVLVLRRVLRPCLPMEWEDYNSFYYEAFIPISLTQFAEPGSRDVNEVVPLEPCCVNEVMKETKRRYEMELEKEMLESSSSSEQQQHRLTQEEEKEKAAKLKSVHELSSQEQNSHFPLPYVSRNTQMINNNANINNYNNTRSLSTSSASKDININTTNINLTLDNIPSQLNHIEIANFCAKSQSLSASSEHINENQNSNIINSANNSSSSNSCNEIVNNAVIVTRRNSVSNNTGGLSEHEKNKRRQALRKNKNNVPVCLYEEVDLHTPHFTHPYVVHHTTAHVSLHLDKTLTKLACDRVRPHVTPVQLIPTRVYRSTPPSQLNLQTDNVAKGTTHIAINNTQEAMESFRMSVKAMT